MIAQSKVSEPFML